MSVEAAHDAFIEAARAFRAAPTFRRASAARAAYRAFHVALVGSGGLAEADAELRRRLARTMARGGAPEPLPPPEPRCWPLGAA